MNKQYIEQMQHLKQSILSVRYTDVESIAFAHTYLGDYYLTQNDNANGGEHLQTARTLCMQHSLHTLLIQVYNLLGICHESLSDEPTAIQFYLDALDLMSRHQIADPFLQCALLNNIGNNFETHQAYETAQFYYLQAMKYTNALQDNPQAGYAVLRLFNNLIETYRQTGDMESAKHYLCLNEALQAAPEYKELVVCQGWCCYYASLGRTEEAGQYVDRLLASSAVQYTDKYFVLSLLPVMCTAMIQLRDRTRARLLLDAILSRCSEEEQKQLPFIQQLNVQFCEALASEEECAAAYRDYYHTTQVQSSLTHHVRVRNMQTILRLHGMVVEKENAVRERQSFEHMANIDELTQLYNRRYFSKQLTKPFYQGTSGTLGIIMVDVDFFKQYNDTYGHAQGDKVLRAVADVLQSCAASGISPCRYGGDEFVCLCEGCGDREIETYIKAVQAAVVNLKLEHKTSRCSDRITLSVGYSNSPYAATDECGEKIFEAADSALYHSKLAGRNTFSRASGG